MNNLLKQPILMIILMFTIVFGAAYGITRASEDSYTITVTSKVPKDDKYLVFTDKGTFEITDTLMYLRFTSSDYWGKLEVGSTYNVTATGYRVGFLSWYENIVDFEKIK